MLLLYRYFVFLYSTLYGFIFTCVLRHWIWSLALLSTLLIPVLTWAVPAWAMPILPSLAAPTVNKPTGWNDPLFLKPGAALSGSGISKINTNIAANKASSPRSAAAIKSSGVSDKPFPATTQNTLSISLSWSMVIFLLWITGCMVMLARWGIQTYHVWRITRRSSAIDTDWYALQYEIAESLRIKRPIRLVVSSEVNVPLTWGLWRPVIVLPVAALGWSSERRRIVLLHESVHIARGLSDSVVSIAKLRRELVQSAGVESRAGDFDRARTILR